MPQYKIGVRPEAGKFRLFNHDATAGPRLIKGDGFPFNHANWWIWDTLPEAMKAAAKLQRYLEAQTRE